MILFLARAAFASMAAARRAYDDEIDIINFVHADEIAACTYP